MDNMFEQLMQRLEGLTDAEYLWEPVDAMWSVRPNSDGVAIVEGAGERDIDPAPVPTIAWRMWHLAMDCFDEYTRRFAGDTADAPNVWTMSAEEAIANLAQTWSAYRAVIDGRDGWEKLGPNWTHWANHTVAHMAMHASNELVHHAAEIALLRDLYRAEVGAPN